ncbi:MAG: flagellar assembly protein FliH [Deltaproteobacteria bacterium]|nr:flagellar assembly protein FliH [Deltaproteobacteria bacterium]
MNHKRAPMFATVPSGVVSLASTLRQVASASVTPWFTPPPPAAPLIDPALVAAAREAEDELADLRAGLAEARAAAIEEGRATGRAAADEICTRLEAATTALAEAREAIAAADAERIVDVALAVAAVIARHALDADHGALVELVREALAAAGPSTSTTMRAHPADLDVIANHVPAEVIVVADETLAPGEVRVEAERAVVDATVKTRLEGLRERLIAAIAEEP